MLWQVQKCAQSLIKFSIFYYSCLRINVVLKIIKQQYHAPIGKNLKQRHYLAFYACLWVFAIVSRYMTNAILDESTYEWGQYVRLSRKFKLNLRHLFLSITFESQIKNDPLLLAVAFLQQVFAKNKRKSKNNKVLNA